MRKRAKVVWTNGYQRLVRVVERDGSRWVKRYVVEVATSDALGEPAWTKSFDLGDAWNSNTDNDPHSRWMIRRILVALVERVAR